MPQVKYIIEELQNMEGDSWIACPIWTVVDVIEQAKHDNRFITKDDAENILDEIHSKHDAELGITWETIRCYLEKYPTLKELQKQELDNEIDRIIKFVSDYEMKYKVNGSNFVQELCTKLLDECGIDNGCACPLCGS